MPPWLETIVRRPLSAACWRESWYLIARFIRGTFAFAFLLAAFTTSVSLVPVLIGIPLLALAAHADRWVCGWDRRGAARILGRPVPAAHREPAGSRAAGRWLSILGDRQTWLDALWVLLLSFPLANVGFILVTTLWPAVLALLSAPIWLWSIPGWVHHHDVLLSIAFPLLAPLAAIAAAWVVGGWALLDASAAALLLGQRRTQVLAERVQTLSETRAGAVDAAVTELQRVERDLHDGAQARLVALAMDLGLAEQRLAHADPETAREHVASARDQARAAMAELRDLVRGIGPSILTDRGLDAALTALAAGRNPPVGLEVDVPEREVDAAQMAAYFVAAEALANARKHAHANRIDVRVRQPPGAGVLVVEVVDDGIGGARVDGGTGLAGLGKRVAALDGALTIDSPPGGPTTVRAELPCGS